MFLNDKDLDNLRNMIIDIANIAIENPNDYELHRTSLLYHLSKLRLRYGEQPILLSTKADFIESEEERILLYKRAVELSLDILDIPCLTQSAESLAEIYIEDRLDATHGLLWLNKLKLYINEYGDDYILNNPSDLEAKLNRLNIKGI